MITVRLPSSLRRGLGEAGANEVHVDEPVSNIAQLVAVLERLHPDLAAPLHDSLYNFAVNDTLILHGADAHPLHDGDIVELIPTIAGGCCSGGALGV